MPIADLSDLVNRLTGGNDGSPEIPFFWIDNRIGSTAATATIAGRFTSLWRYNRSWNGTSSLPPSTVAAPTRATEGALPFTNPGGGRTKYFLGGFPVATGGGGGLITLYDRLLHISGFSGTNTGAQNVGGSLTRNTSGLGNQIWIEINTQIGATATTITASYTDQDGNSGQTTPAVAIGGTGLREAERMIPLTLADGDTGVQAVASVTLAATTGTVGDFGVVVARPLATWAAPGSGTGQPIDHISGVPGLRQIDSDACLAVMFLSLNVTPPQIWWNYSMCEA